MVGAISIPQEPLITSSTRGLLSDFTTERARELEFGAFADAMEGKHVNPATCECNAEAASE